MKLIINSAGGNGDPRSQLLHIFGPIGLTANVTANLEHSIIYHMAVNNYVCNYQGIMI